MYEPVINKKSNQTSKKGRIIRSSRWKIRNLIPIIESQMNTIKTIPNVWKDSINSGIINSEFFF